MGILDRFRPRKSDCEQRLIEAIKNGKVGLVPDLLRRGEKMDERDAKERTALYYAAFTGEADVVTDLPMVNDRVQFPNDL